MKKKIIFLISSLLVLLFFACDYKMPTAVEIKGNPSVRFDEKVEIGSMFTDLLDKAINDNNQEGVTILSCKNTHDFTFLVHMELLNQDFDLDYDPSIPDELPTLPDLPGIDLGEILEELVNQPVTLSNSIDIIKSDEPINVPFSSIGSLLDGFEFDGNIIKLYFSGTDIIEKIKLDVKFYSIKENGELHLEYTYDGRITASPDGLININSWKNNGYTDTDLPDGGFKIENLKLDGKDIAVEYRVYIPAGETVTLEDLQGGHIKVDAAIWLPIVLIAKAGGAEIEFPKDALFSSDSDLFGRDSQNTDSMITDIIKSLSLEIQFSQNPFSGAELVVTSQTAGGDKIEIRNVLTDTSFPFAISEEDMKKINLAKNIPFTPNFKLSFPGGKTIKFPKEFNATRVIFSAKIKYRIDL
ncbi:hypothetical protein R84B8_03236 [Treponema sp. R8-4-B8]